MSTLLFLTAIVLSGIAAYYSVIGLIAIFSAAVIPVAIMGGSLEAAKLVVASWLYRYWDAIPRLMKAYFTFALVILMLITSMGIFGFLSKAHNDQSLVSGDVLSRISLYDEKIRTAKENIDANRKAIKQLDEAVDQVMARSTTEQGADKAVQIRRSQSKERARLLQEIEAEQKKITKLNEERAPIAAEVRKVEAEVGPIKYIAALIYGDNPDSNLLERAVRWLIILLIIVFDPLAVLMLIAANLTQMRQAEWRKAEAVVPPREELINDKQDKDITDKTELSVAAQTEKQPDAPTFDAEKIVPSAEQSTPMEEVGIGPAPAGWMFQGTTEELDKNIEKKLDIVHKLHQDDTEKPKKKSKKDNESTPAPAEPLEQVMQDKSVSENENKQAESIDTQIQNLIDNNKEDQLEEVYKKIVKELAKKNRAKSTHWGPLR